MKDTWQSTYIRKDRMLNGYTIRRLPTTKKQGRTHKPKPVWCNVESKNMDKYCNPIKKELPKNLGTDISFIDLRYLLQNSNFEMKIHNKHYIFEDEIDKLEGICGWLLIPALWLLIEWIYVVLFINSVVLYSIKHFSLLFDIFSKIIRAGDAVFYLIMGIILFISLLIFMLYVSIQFFRKKQNAPKIMIILLILEIPFAENFIVSLIRSLIWISYFCVSRRVRNTFVN